MPLAAHHSTLSVPPVPIGCYLDGIMLCAGAIGRLTRSQDIDDRSSSGWAQHLVEISGRPLVMAERLTLQIDAA